MKKTKKINEKRLAAYAAAASAALMAASPANAAVQYSGPLDIDVPVGWGPGVLIDIDGTPIEARLFGSLSWMNGMIYGAYFAGAGSYYGGDVSNLGASTFIDSSMGWFNAGTSAGGALFNANSCGGVTNVDGNFRPGTVGPDNGFIGIMFDVGVPMVQSGMERVMEDSAFKYGWIHVDEVNPAEGFYHIDGWAYEDSGAGIQAGDIGVVPEPSSIALFAVGAAGLSAWRRRKNRK